MFIVSILGLAGEVGVFSGKVNSDFPSENAMDCKVPETFGLSKK
jgi:hypothetical protein